MMRKILVLLAVLLVMAQVSAAIEGRLFQPNGENLMIQPLAGWRLAYMNGDPDGEYVVEFLPQNESLDSWREGYMSVQRRALPTNEVMHSLRAGNQHMATVAVKQVVQEVQSHCSGRFVPMSQKDSVTHGAYTSVSGGFCDRYGNGVVAPYGEGSMMAVVEGGKYMFIVQFGWRPATVVEWKNYAWRITPQRLQQYLDLLNNAKLCGGADQMACPR